MLWLCLLPLALSACAASSTCGRPLSGPVIFLETSKDVFFPGEKVEYKCRPGYRRSLIELKVMCKQDGSWTSPSGCVPKTCPIVEDPKNGAVHYSDSGTIFGANVTFECNKGYQLVGANQSYCMIITNDLMGWSEPSPICVEVFCRPPKMIENGFYRPIKEVYTHLEFVEYSCRGTNNVPWSLVGDGMRVCNDGDWTGSDPECKLVICPYPQIPWGYVAATVKKVYVMGDRVQVACRPGYTLVGDDFGSVCSAKSEWDPPLARCVRGEGHDPEATTLESITISSPGGGDQTGEFLTPEPGTVASQSPDSPFDGPTLEPVPSRVPPSIPTKTETTATAGTTTTELPPIEPIIPDPHVTHVRNVIIISSVFVVCLILLVCMCFMVIK